MPGISAGKSLVLRVIRMRPLTWAVARMIASGNFSLGRSRRSAAARVRDFARRFRRFRSRQESLRPSQRAAVVAFRQHLDPGHTTDPAGVERRADFGMRRAIAVQRIDHDIASKVKPLTDARAASSHLAWPADPDRFAADDHLRHRTDQGIRPSPPRNRHPTAESMSARSRRLSCDRSPISSRFFQMPNPSSSQRQSLIRLRLRLIGRHRLAQHRRARLPLLGGTRSSHFMSSSGRSARMRVMMIY